MQHIFFTIFATIFCFINYKIIISDQKIKKIPNKNLLQLLILLPFWYIFLYFFPIWNFEIFGFILQIFASFLISFLLFNFGIWRAWDAKYLLILSLFIPYIWIISFIWNLWLFTLFYLFLYFLWFFIGKSFFIKWYFSNLIGNIKIDLQEKWKFYKNSQKWNTFVIIFKWILIFLVIFVSLRLARIYLFLEFFENFSTNENTLEIFQKYHFYLIFVWIWLTIWIYYIWKKIINFLKFFFAKTFKIDIRLIWNIFLGVLFFALIYFIFKEFQTNPEEISNYLIKIFTIYIFIYIFAKIIFYGYKLSFLWSEKRQILLKDLKQSDYVDISELNKIFHFRHLPWDEWFKKLYDDAIFGNNFDLKNLKKLIRIQNQYDKKYRKEKNKPIISITCLKTFSFAIYIFIGFIITFFFENKIILHILEKILNFFFQ